MEGISTKSRSQCSVFIFLSEWGGGGPKNNLKFDKINIFLGVPRFPPSKWWGGGAPKISLRMGGDNNTVPMVWTTDQKSVLSFMSRRHHGLWTDHLPFGKIRVTHLKIYKSRNQYKNTLKNVNPRREMHDGPGEVIFGAPGAHFEGFPFPA